MNHITVECAADGTGCGQKEVNGIVDEIVPWYLSAVPVLWVHVRHGKCPLRCNLDGIEVLGTDAANT